MTSGADLKGILYLNLNSKLQISLIKMVISYGVLTVKTTRAVKKCVNTPDISNSDVLLFHFHFTECMLCFQCKYEVEKF